MKGNLLNIIARELALKFSNVPKANLTNITIKKLQDKNFNDYYVIVNNDNQDEAYFCFEKTVKEGWQ